MQGYDVLQSSTAYPLVFLLIQSSDHITPLTGATATVTLSKNGAAFGSPAGAVSEIGSGWYKVAGNATDTGTLGPLLLHATATSGDPTDAMFPVVAVNPQSTAYGLSLAKTTNLTGFNDIAATAVVSSGAIATSGGAVSSVGSVTGSVGGNVTGTVGSVTAPVSIAVTGLDAIIIESGLNLPQALSVIAAACAGVSTVVGNAVTYAAAGNSAVRISAQASGGVRTSVTLTPPSI
jgi:hypothetical protein